MNKQLKSLVLIAFIVGTTLPQRLYAQASTQGTEFWVSSTIVCSPDKSTATPYIAVSAEKECTVTIKGGVGNAINITKKVGAGSWTEFNNNNGLTTDKWYPVSMNDANNVSSLAGKINKYGLQITATEKISVYVILSSKNSMDASNILPVTAIQSEYYTQDFWSKVKSGFDNAVGMTTILATEDGTVVTIDPSDTPFGRSNASPFDINLNKGETYYLMTGVGKKLSGTHIKEKNGRKIAVFCGVPLTNIPTGIAARDCLFEQAMPIEYWGTQFIATRSLEKDGNVIGITAMMNGTELRIDGYTQGYINEGETYYLVLQGDKNPNGRNPGTTPFDNIITADAAYIETSCPCAVYSYDTGNDYQGGNGTEIVGGKGDPSSVWVSPVQQKIGQITFGTCYTGKTKDHFLNVVAETATCDKTTLTAIAGSSNINKSSSLKWQPVPGNPTYSYARAKIGDAQSQAYSVFRLENPNGFIAHIYGNGGDESYAYSAGSSAVEQGVRVNTETFTTGTMSSSNFCLNDELTFDALAGSDEVSRIDWDFGDGTTYLNGEVSTTHKYTTPGWYDVTAVLYGHQACTDIPDQYIGTVQFTFRIIRPDTLYADTLICADDLAEFQFPNAPTPKTYHMKDPTKDEIIIDTLATGTYCDDVYILTIYAVGKRDSIVDLDLIYPAAQRRDSALIPADEYGTPAEWVYTSGSYERKFKRTGVPCDSTVTYKVTVLKCLDLVVRTDSTENNICDQGTYVIPYTHDLDGKSGNAYVIDGKRKTKITLTPDEEDNDSIATGTISLSVGSWTVGTHRVLLSVEDLNCEDTITTDSFNIVIPYPQSVIKYKFGNVLAVYKKGYGGNTNPGWDFIAYQWYYDGKPIEGANTSVYHNPSGKTFAEDKLFGEFTVNLVQQGTTTWFMSCPFSISADDTDDSSTGDDSNPAPARKVMSNRQILIIRDGQTYNAYGQRVQ